MTGRASKLVSLSWAERGLLVGASIALLGSKLMLPVIGFERTRYIVDAMVRVLPPYHRLDSPATVRWSIGVVDGYLPTSLSCLEHALVCASVLRHAGKDPQLHLGVDLGDGFRAHAWVESNGEIVVGDIPDLDQYTPLASYGSE